jgi:hypothetical protein
MAARNRRRQVGEIGCGIGEVKSASYLDVEKENEDSEEESNNNAACDPQY